MSTIVDFAIAVALLSVFGSVAWGVIKFLWLVVEKQKPPR